MMRSCVLFAGLCLLSLGCSAMPKVMRQEQYHNPFPQLSRVAILPFFNQSDDPTVDQDRMALAYYNELQKVPGFEVMPVGVAKQLLQASGVEPQGPEDFQRLARFMGVDAVVVGSVTEFSAYYPPRMGLVVNWYAANPCFHAIPPGYGLPWGTRKEKRIPQSTVFDSEMALAREQLKTQTPGYPLGLDKPSGVERLGEPKLMILDEQHLEQGFATGPPPGAGGPELPADWPDSRGFHPAPPGPIRPPCEPHRGPVLTHTRIYHGHDDQFTEQLAAYFFFRDDARFGGWESYLQRSEDFIAFCCHLHISEMLAARGGTGKRRLALRWPKSR